jgi:nitrogen fixation/metabolism regulation signal transduction histidine kinase
MRETTFDDITDLVSAQRTAARRWRRIPREIRITTPIQLSAGR